MNKVINWFLNPPITGQSSILIIRLMAGCVFFWEGILKFVYVNQGVGRFTKLGFAYPGMTAHFVGVAEIIGSLLLIFGLFTRITAFYFIVQMIVAVLSTKIASYMAQVRYRYRLRHLKTAFGLCCTKYVLIMRKL